MPSCEEPANCGREPAVAPGGTDRENGRGSARALVHVGLLVGVAGHQRLGCVEEDPRPVLRDAVVVRHYWGVPAGGSGRHERRGATGALVDILGSVGVAGHQPLRGLEEDLRAVGGCSEEFRALGPVAPWGPGRHPCRDAAGALVHVERLIVVSTDERAARGEEDVRPLGRGAAEVAVVRAEGARSRARRDQRGGAALTHVDVERVVGVLRGKLLVALEEHAAAGGCRAAKGCRECAVPARAPRRQQCGGAACARVKVERGIGVRGGELLLCAHENPRARVQRADQVRGQSTVAARRPGRFQHELGMVCLRHARGQAQQRHHDDHRWPPSRG